MELNDRRNNQETKLSMNTVNKPLKNITITFIKLVKDVRFKIQMIILFSKKERTTSLLMLISLAVVMIISTNTGYCMTPEENAKAIISELEQNNTQAARELLETLNNQNLSPSDMAELDELMNTRLNTNPDNTYGVHQGNLHNSGNPMDSSTSITWRDIALALTIAVTFTISIYLIYKYWEDIRNTLFGSPQTVTNISSTITNPVQRAMIRRLQQIGPENLPPRFVALALAIIHRRRTDAEE